MTFFHPQKVKGQNIDLKKLSKFVKRIDSPNIKKKSLKQESKTIENELIPVQIYCPIIETSSGKKDSDELVYSDS